MIKKLCLIVVCLLLSVSCLQAQKTVKIKRGRATYYHNKFHGQRTSDGGKYNRDSLTCAHRSYPFGTKLRVTNPSNGKSVIVVVTDRGPYNKKLMIDLSYKAAKEIEIVSSGTAIVEVNKIEDIQIPLRPVNGESIFRFMEAKTLNDEPCFMSADK